MRNAKNAMIPINKILEGDCIAEMKKLPDNSVDAVITDPPYGIGFMGKKWDTFKPENVARGIASSSRKKSYLNPKRSAEARRGASGAWESARYDLSQDGNRAFQDFTFEWCKEAIRVLKPGGHLLSCCGTRTYHRMATGIEDAGFEIRDIVAWLYGSGFPKSLDIAKAIDKQKGIWRGKAGQAIEGDTRRSLGQHYEKTEKGEPATLSAKAWQGWGTALKPAMELWTLARKPLSEKTVAENVLKWGTGGIHINGTRVGELPRHNASAGNKDLHDRRTVTPISKQGETVGRDTFGRWPANLIHDGLEQEWARFFYCAKSSQAERDSGLDSLQIQSAAVRTNRREGSAGINAFAGATGPARNIHPTVKPLALMRYLCKLVTPQGGVILDPFMGSGTTGVSAKLEGFNFIGIEKENSYVKISSLRISAVEKEKKTGNLFAN